MKPNPINESLEVNNLKYITKFRFFFNECALKTTPSFPYLYLRNSIISHKQSLFENPGLKIYISRNVGGEENPKEAFVEVGHKKLVRYLEITEEKVLPILLLIFSAIYWAYGISLYVG